MVSETDEVWGHPYNDTTRTIGVPEWASKSNAEIIAEYDPDLGADHVGGDDMHTVINCAIMKYFWFHLEKETTNYDPQLVNYPQFEYEVLSKCLSDELTGMLIKHAAHIVCVNSFDYDIKSDGKPNKQLEEEFWEFIRTTTEIRYKG